MPLKLRSWWVYVLCQQYSQMGPKQLAWLKVYSNCPLWVRMAIYCLLSSPRQTSRPHPRQIYKSWPLSILTMHSLISCVSCCFDFSSACSSSHCLSDTGCQSYHCYWRRWLFPGDIAISCPNWLIATSIFCWAWLCPRLVGPSCCCWANSGVSRHWSFAGFLASFSSCSVKPSKTCKLAHDSRWGRSKTFLACIWIFCCRTSSCRVRSTSWTTFAGPMHPDGSSFRLEN